MSGLLFQSGNSILTIADTTLVDGPDAYHQWRPATRTRIGSCALNLDPAARI